MSTEQTKEILEEKKEIDKHRAIYAVCKDVFEQEWGRVDSLDKKARIFLAVLAFEFTAFAIAIKGFQLPEKHLLFLNTYHLILLSSIASMFAAFSTIMWALMIRAFATYPKLSVIRGFENDSEIKFLKSMQNHLEKVVKMNRRKINKKASLLKIGASLLIISSLLIFFILCLIPFNAWLTLITKQL